MTITCHDLYDGQVKHWMDPQIIPFGWGLFSEDEEVLKAALAVVAAADIDVHVIVAVAAVVSVFHPLLLLQLLLVLMFLFCVFVGGRI